MQRFTAELRRVLRPGGMVLLMSGVATGEARLPMWKWKQVAPKIGSLLYMIYIYIHVYIYIYTRIYNYIYI